ncbi:hypothetical protein EJ066_17665 [Mesorhizobium sp. M9A.F.Ca.ET.002.03.1.2]|uniref:hypothetical protein n=1 Tax=Mesorhizobium sp. M9A.F.Ca.ET.002.03.1.2 TaxID=2493668 RepID=UPI000F764930|nr:hypothetical protein [Mesorhizobium sp. M9A.F.Ca.ET.002.03.1.2]AZN98826.1 hypothetical protein EJ066_17665 [Mesorhizobium sp. M9A.F.Ca.ET.002.03.1.2]
MDYRKWIDLFGRKNDDPQVKEQLKRAGVIKRVVMPRDEIYLTVDADGMTLQFEDVELFKDVPGGAGTCVLTSVTMHVKREPWPAPYDISKDATRPSLRKKFGTPVEQEEAWDQWRMSDNLLLRARYKIGGDALMKVTLSMEEPK